MLPFVWVLLGLADLGVPRAWADDAAPASTSGAIEVKDLPPYPSFRSLDLGTRLDALKGKTLSTATVKLVSDLGGEGLDENSALQVSGATFSVATGGVYTFKAADAKAGFKGDDLLSALAGLRVRFIPGAAGRSLRVDWAEVDSGGTKGAPGAVATQVTAGFAPPISGRVSGVGFRDEPHAPDSRGLAPPVPTPESVTIGPDLLAAISVGEAPAAAVRALTVTGLHFDPGDKMGPLAGCVKDTGAERLVCKPSGGAVPLSDALGWLSGLSLTLPSGYQAREIHISATWEASGVSHEAALAKVQVLPAMPAAPAGCVGVELLRYGPGKDWLQGTGADRPDAVAVLRSQAVLDSAVVVAPWYPRREGKKAARTADGCGKFVEGHKLDDLAYRLVLTPTPMSGAIPVAPVVATSSGTESTTPTKVVVSAPVPIVTAESAGIGRAAGSAYVVPESAHLGFVPAWKQLGDTTSAALVTKSSTNQPDGEFTLYATVQLVSRDGANTANMLTDVAVIAMVDEDPLLTLEVVTHPGSTTITFLKCRDVGAVGDLSNAELEADACVDRPSGNVVSGSLQLVPAGLKLRYAPFYQLPWVGFSAEVNATGIGISKVFTEVTGDGVEAGLASYANAIVGFEVNTVDRASDTDPKNAPVGFTLGGGVSLLQGAEGPVAAGVVGLSISVRAFEFSK